MISGDDANFASNDACGADGVISVISNAYPKDFSEMIRIALDGNFEKSRKLHYKLLEIMHAIFIDGNPSGVKGLMTAMGICSEHVLLTADCCEPVSDQ